jgi:hypothetical protein
MSENDALGVLQTSSKNRLSIPFFHIAVSTRLTKQRRNIIIINEFYFIFLLLCIEFMGFTWSGS